MLPATFPRSSFPANPQEIYQWDFLGYIAQQAQMNAIDTYTQLDARTTQSFPSQIHTSESNLYIRRHKISVRPAWDEAQTFPNLMGVIESPHHQPLPSPLAPSVAPDYIGLKQDFESVAWTSVDEEAPRDHALDLQDPNVDLRSLPDRADSFPIERHSPVGSSAPQLDSDNHEERAFFCPVQGCGRRYRYKGDLKVHCARKHKNLVRLDAISKSKSSKENKSFPCPLLHCKCGYELRRDFLRHLRAKHYDLYLEHRGMRRPSFTSDSGSCAESSS